MKKINKVSAFALAVVFALELVGPNVVLAVTTPSLGAATTFGILSSTYVNTVAGTTINGDLGYTTGPAMAPTVNGTTHIANATYNQAGIDQGSALANLNGQACVSIGAIVALDAYDTDGPGGLPPGTFSPGCYSSTGAMNITVGTTVTLSGAGTYIFRPNGALTTGANSIVFLAGGASACDVFWTPTGATTLGANSTFRGTNIDDAGITIGSTVGWIGRALAFGGTVSTDTDTITVPTCGGGGGGSSSNTPRNFTVVKQVINDSGGTATISDFPLFVNGSPVTSGVSVAMIPGAYVVTETTRPNYTATFGGDCNTEGEVTHGSGNSTLCTVINNDIGPASAIVPPLIDVVKVPSPLALPGGPGPMTYTYTLRNVGTVPVTNVTMIGDTCSPITLISGDTDTDTQLDVNETWVYRCSTTLTATHTNTVVATGWANGITATDIASATVVVGASVVSPLIHVTKIPNILTMFGAGPVTYNYAITNPGTVPMSNVAVSDDRCSQISITSAGNNNGWLEPGEVWNFTCQMNLLVTTTNTVSVSGEANGFIVRDFALATVVVSNPAFPGAGLPPAKANLWGIIISAGMLILISASFVLAKRYIKI